MSCRRDCREHDDGIIADGSHAFKGHVAGALDGPFVGLLLEDGADQADDGFVVWKDADHVDGPQPGLAFFKLGKAVRYRYGDLIAFLETRRASSTLVARQLPQSPVLGAPSGVSVKASPRPRKARNAASLTEGQQSLF